MPQLVSVVIPNYNGGLYLEAALTSVFAQNYLPIEVIVIDDGSTDESLSILENYKNQIILINSKHKGAGAARNLGISRAKGYYIALLDSDDVWEVDKLSLQVRYLEESSLDLVYCHGVEFGPIAQSKLVHTARYSGDCYPLFKKYPTRGIIELGCSTAIFRRELLEISGVFDETFSGAAEDWDFFRRYCRVGKVGYFPQVLVQYRRHAESITGRSKQDYYFGNRKAILNMFREDSEIQILERRIIWAKFHYMSTKSFLKDGRILLGFKSLIAILFPIDTKVTRDI